MFSKGGNRVLVALLESADMEEGRCRFLGDQMGFDERNQLHLTLGWQARDTGQDSHFMKLSKYGIPILSTMSIMSTMPQVHLVYTEVCPSKS